MPTWELRGFSTEEHGDNAVRHRDYTTSQKRAEEFDRIPRLDFTDSGHGIVFAAVRHTGPRKERRHMDYVDRELAKLRGKA